MVWKRGSMSLVLVGAVLGSACASSAEGGVDAVAHDVTFDEFVASLPVDEETGAFVLEDDILVYERSELTDYYAAQLFGTALTLDETSAGVDNKYSVAQATQLTYCVSDSFGTNKEVVRDTFAAAAQEWMDATKIAASDSPTVRFRYLSAEDRNCVPGNINVFFNVSPSTSSKFDAASFLPHYSRGKRQMLITSRAMTPYKERTFLGVLRHEIGHILGFKHEHINKSATPCPETDTAWRPLTEYDLPSVMHYRNIRSGFCKNSAAVDYVLTTLDNAGVRCAYTTQARAAAGTAGDACRALTSYSAAASSFVIDGNGALYRLSQSTSIGQRTSTVARYVAPGTSSKQSWTTLWSATEPVATATVAIYAGGSQLYRRTATALHRWTGKAWAAISGGAGSAVTVTYSSGDLFRLNASGTIDRVVAGATAAATILTTAAADRKLFPGTTELYRIEANGDLYLWSAGSWSGRIGTGIRAVAKTEAGATFCLLNDAAGTVMLRKSGGSWAAIGSRARAIWGGLEVPYMSLMDDPATAASETTIIARNTSGSRWHRYALSSTRIMKGGNRRIAINTNGRPYAYATP
jgi:serralysin